jgi:DNA-binding LytR/AlgR family response regulator
VVNVNNGGGKSTQRRIREIQGLLRDMTDNAVHDTRVAASLSPKEMSFGARHKRGFMIAAIVGLLLTFVGALETGELPILQRLAYWEILMLSGAMIGLGVSESVEKWGRLRNRPSLEMPLVAVLIALPLTFMVVGTSSLFFRTRPPTLEALGIMFAATFFISLVMTALSYFIHWPGKLVAETSQARRVLQPEAITARFADRLPLPLRSSSIIALEAEDHYLRVHLTGGQSTLILMRLSDAIAELPADTGAQTHRSWWVAKDAVRGVTKADGRAALALTTSLEAPVSRSFYKVLNDAGWLN